MTTNCSVRYPPLSVDVRTELTPYIPDIDRYADKYNGPSPFRYDRHPSFFVNLSPASQYYGTWGDSGAEDPDWASGNITKLLAYYRNETYGETLDYLRAKYGGAPEESEEIPLHMPFLTADKRPPIILPESTLDPYKWRSPYLAGRGITEEAQRLYGVGYDRKRRAITLPWRLPDGRLGNVKFRRVGEKTFWYAKGARPIRELIYGIDVIYRYRYKRAVIVEGEVDALSFVSAGIPALATGGASAFSAAKRDMLIRSPLEEVVLVRDNDKAGRMWRNTVARALAPYIVVKLAILPKEVKDTNEYLVSRGINAVANKAKRARNVAGCRYILMDYKAQR